MNFTEMDDLAVLRSDEDYIFWDVRELTKDDFHGPIEDVQETIARTYTTMQLDWDEKIFQKESSFHFRIENIRTDAIFGRKKSWAKPEFYENHERHSGMLKHEQGHFDLCEECIRQLRDKVMHLEGQDFTCEGDNEEVRKELDHKEATRIMEEIYNPETQRHSNLQREYEEQTNHGWYIDQQNIWDARFQKLRE